jgi:hypothetical protein
MIGRALRTAGALLIGAATLVASGGGPSAATANTPAYAVYALADANLIRFSSATPSTIDATVPITGIVAGDVLHGIDVRPATGQLYGMGVNSTPNPDTLRLYVIDRATGQATAVTIGAVNATGNASRYSIDFNPASDRVRVIDDTGGNQRLNPNNGALAAVDTAISPVGANVRGIAYDRNVAARSAPSTTPTTLYAIKADGNLVHVGGLNGTPSPNGGVVTNVGPLGSAVPGSNSVGFDITADNVGLASIPIGIGEYLHVVDLASGNATAIGPIGTGGLHVRDIAVDAAGVAAGASQYVGVSSYRLVDTREAGGKVAAGGVLTVPVTNRGPIPATGVSAVVLNVTVTQPDAPGYTTVWPSGTPMTDTSSVNVDATDQTRATLVTVPVGPDGAVKVFSERGSHVIVDVVGYFQPARDAQGRLFTLTPTRLLDTRTGVGQPDDTPAKPTDATTVELTVAGRGGVPATGATAAILNLTMTATDAPGYLTAYGGDVPQPLASNLNASAAGETIANLAIVPIGAGGTVKLFTERGTQLVVDVVGYFGAQPFISPKGLFVPLQPGRILDTRIGLGAPQASVGPGWSINATFAGQRLVPSDALAVAGTVTATESQDSGYVTVYPTSGSLPTASTLNTVRAGQTIANSIILGLGTQGQLTLYSETGTHLLADVTGYFSS